MSGNCVINWMSQSSQSNIISSFCMNNFTFSGSRYQILRKSWLNINWTHKNKVPKSPHKLPLHIMVGLLGYLPNDSLQAKCLGTIRYPIKWSNHPSILFFFSLNGPPKFHHSLPQPCFHVIPILYYHLYLQN